MNTRKFVFSTLIAAGLAISFTAQANACGVIGCIVDSVAPGVGTALDKANAAAGRPFDHAVAGAMNAYVPGSGTALEAGWAIQRSGALDGFNQPIGQPAQPAAVAAPMPYCAFADGQRFPLPPAAVPNGAPCWHQFANGVFDGQVVWN